MCWIYYISSSLSPPYIGERRYYIGEKKRRDIPSSFALWARNRDWRSSWEKERREATTQNCCLFPFPLPPPIYRRSVGPKGAPRSIPIPTFQRRAAAAIAGEQKGRLNFTRRKSRKKVSVFADQGPFPPPSSSEAGGSFESFVCARKDLFLRRYCTCGEGGCSSCG